MSTPAGKSTQQFPSRSTTDPEQSKAFAVEAARTLADDRCEDVIVLDVRELSQVTDYIIIGSGTSERQMRAVIHHVEDLGAEMGFRAFRSSSDDRTSWLLGDFVDVVVHIFEPNMRAHYDLEMLWGDAGRVAWERPAGETRRRPAGQTSEGSEAGGGGLREDVDLSNSSNASDALDAFDEPDALDEQGT